MTENESYAHKTASINTKRNKVRNILRGTCNKQFVNSMQCKINYQTLSFDKRLSIKF